MSCFVVCKFVSLHKCRSLAYAVFHIILHVIARLLYFCIKRQKL